MSLVDRLFRRGREQVQPETERLIFIKPGGVLPIGSSERVADQRSQLRSNPDTTDAIQAIEKGPNAALYEKLVTKIKEVELDEETGEYLVAAASSLFFGNSITDANIEGMILCGGSTKWKNASGIDIMHLSETVRPEGLLIEERVVEIVRGEFTLPQNEQDLKRNAELQIARIGKQVLDGTLRRKASAMSISRRGADIVGERMIDSVQKVRDIFIPGIEAGL